MERRKAKVFVSQFMHETNTFCRLPCGLENFKQRELHIGESVITEHLGSSSELGGFMGVATRNEWIVVPGLSADATPCGIVSAEAYTSLTGELLHRLAMALPLNGVFLALHGAMVSEKFPDADGELLRRVREIVGPTIPIAITLDLHANVSDAMAMYANTIVAYRTYPHVDTFACGRLAGELLAQQMTTGLLHRCELHRPATLFGCNHGRTSEGQMLDLLAVANSLERNTGNSVSVLAGFPWADVFEAGPSVVVSGTPGPSDKAFGIDLSRTIWDRRQESSLQPTTSDRLLEELTWNRQCPLVIADYSDNPGGGGHGDATNLLRLLLRADRPGTVFGGIWDPAAADIVHQAGAGATVELELGGHIAPESGGEPVILQAFVRTVTDGEYVSSGPMYQGRTLHLGKSALVSVSNVDIVIISRRMQVFDLNFFRAFGIEPARCQVIGLKSLQHFRGAFEPIASQVRFFDSGGLVSEELRRFAYQHVRRPIWPLDDTEGADQAT
ncbi:MAG: M81 family metallopeptidase [Reyranellaceae bacterium]